MVRHSIAAYRPHRRRVSRRVFTCGPDVATIAKTRMTRRNLTRSGDARRPSWSSLCRRLARYTVWTCLCPLERPVTQQSRRRYRSSESEVSADIYGVIVETRYSRREMYSDNKAANESERRLFCEHGADSAQSCKTAMDRHGRTRGPGRWFHADLSLLSVLYVPASPVYFVFCLTASQQTRSRNGASGLNF